MIPYGKHTLGSEECNAVEQLLKNGWLTQGPKVEEFEEAFSKLTNSTYACSVNSATSALHLAYVSLGVGPASKVWTSANTFVATSNAALMCGARVDFIDIDLTTGNLCLEKLESKLKLAELSGDQPDVITVVHFAGHPVDMAKMKGLSEKYGFKTVEDSSHATGAEGVSREKIGSCEYSDISVFSFHPVKIMTTAEGGMLTTNTEDLYRKVKSLRSHGIDKDLHNRGSSWEFDQEFLGYNYRLSDLQAVIGLEQIKKVDGFLNSRREIAKKYDKEFLGLEIEVTKPPDKSLSSYHLYPVLLNKKINLKLKERVFSSLRDMGIGVNVHYKPVYLNSYYKNLGFKQNHCPNSEEFYLRELSLPIFPDLNVSDQEIVISSVKKVLESI